MFQKNNQFTISIYGHRVSRNVKRYALSNLSYIMKNSGFVSLREGKFWMKHGTDTILEEVVKYALKETKVTRDYSVRNYWPYFLMTPLHWAGCSNGSVLGLCWGGAEFVYRLGQRLYWLIITGISSVHPPDKVIRSRAHLPNSFEVTIDPAIYTVAYLFHARMVDPQKQPWLSNTRTQQ